MKVFISVCLCGPHAYTQIEHMHCPLAFLYFTSRLFTPRCPHTEKCDQNDAVQWIYMSNGRCSHVRSVFGTQQRCECALKVSMCAVMCMCVRVRLTLHSVVSLQRKEHINWNKLDLAGCKGVVLWTQNHWNSMEYSVHFWRCYAQLFLLFLVLKRRNTMQS